jgi:hypothetical protein
MSLVVEERTEPACRCSTGRLDFDHVGAQIAEDLSAQEPALGGQIKNAIR